MTANDDGNFSNLVDLFARNLTTDVTTLVNVDFDGQVNGTGGSGNNNVTNPTINADGSVIAFLSTGTNLVSPALSGSENDVFAVDLSALPTISTTLVSVNTNGVGDGSSNLSLIHI